MEKVIFTPFGQKRKFLYKRNVLGTSFRPESQKRGISTLESKKVKNVHIFTSGALLAPETLQNGKVDPKVKKRIWAFLAPTTCPDAYVFHCSALGAKNMISALRALLRFSAFWVQKHFLASKSGNTSLKG